MLALILHGKCWLLLIKAQGDYDLPIISNLAGYKARPWTLSSQHLYLCQAFLFHVIYMYDLRKVRDKPGSNNSKIQLFRIFISLLHCVQLLSHVLLFVTASHQAPLSFTICWSLLKFMSIESVVLSNQPILCCPLLLLPSVFPSLHFYSTIIFESQNNLTG